MNKNFSYYAGKPLPWLEKHDYYPEIVLNSELSFIRNVENLSFSLKQNDVACLLKVFEVNDFSDLKVYSFKDLKKSQTLFLLERYFDDTYQINNSPITVNEQAMLVHNDELHYIFINGEDNLKMVHRAKGADLNFMYDSLVENLESPVSKHLNYSYSDKYGFLSSNPLFSGTGFKIETNLNLFALNFFNRIDTIKKSLVFFDLNLFSKYSLKQNNVFCLHNISCASLTDDELIKKFKETLHTIILLEKEARQELLELGKDHFFDLIAQAYTRLRFSQAILPIQALVCFYMVRVGFFYKLFEKLSLEKINYLTTISLQSHFMEKFSIDVRAIPIELSLIIRESLF